MNAKVRRNTIGVPRSWVVERCSKAINLRSGRRQTPRPQATWPALPAGVPAVNSLARNGAPLRLGRGGKSTPGQDRRRSPSRIKASAWLVLVRFFLGLLRRLLAGLLVFAALVGRR